MIRLLSRTRWALRRSNLWLTVPVVLGLLSIVAAFMPFFWTSLPLIEAPRTFLVSLRSDCAIGRRVAAHLDENGKVMLGFGIENPSGQVARYGSLQAAKASPPCTIFRASIRSKTQRVSARVESIVLDLQNRRYLEPIEQRYLRNVHGETLRTVSTLAIDPADPASRRFEENFGTCNLNNATDGRVQRNVAVAADIGSYCIRKDDAIWLDTGRQALSERIFDALTLIRDSDKRAESGAAPAIESKLAYLKEPDGQIRGLAESRVNAYAAPPLLIKQVRLSFECEACRTSIRNDGLFALEFTDGVDPSAAQPRWLPTAASLTADPSMIPASIRASGDKLIFFASSAEDFFGKDFYLLVSSIMLGVGATLLIEVGIVLLHRYSTDSATPDASPPEPAPVDPALARRGARARLRRTHNRANLAARRRLS